MQRDDPLEAALRQSTATALDGEIDEAYFATLLEEDRPTVCLGALPDEYWLARPALTQIRRAAHARVRSAPAVLGAVLARMAALTPPTVQLPAIVGSAATLDLLVGIIGPSGAGKSTGPSVAAELVPFGERDDIIEGLTIGSGEGLIDAYLGPPEQVTMRDGTTRRVRPQRIMSVLAFVDEGQTLAELSSRRGSTLMPTLRSAWSGAALGQANAAAETNRRLDAGRYRLAAIIGWQPEHAAAILDDAAGGTPQRIVWFTATDPAIPDLPPAWPGPLHFRPPARITTGTEMDVEDCVVREIRGRALARARGESRDESALDAHRDLSTLKIAALHAILDGRLTIDAEDWRLAGIVMSASRSVRTLVAETARADVIRREQANTARAVRRDEALATSAERRALESAARSIGRRVHKLGTATRRDLDRAVAGQHRALLGDVAEAVDAAIAEGWVARDGDGFKPGRSVPK